MFPLLDPRLDFKRAKKAHCISQILTDVHKKYKPDLSKLERQRMIFKLCEDYPAVMAFIPSQAIVKCLVQRAIKLESEEQIHRELNPSEIDCMEGVPMDEIKSRIKRSSDQYPTMHKNKEFYSQVGLYWLSE